MMKKRAQDGTPDAIRAVRKTRLSVLEDLEEEDSGPLLVSNGQVVSPESQDDARDPDFDPHVRLEKRRMRWAEYGRELQQDKHQQQQQLRLLAQHQIQHEQARRQAWHGERMRSQSGPNRGEFALTRGNEQKVSERQPKREKRNKTITGLPLFDSDCDEVEDICAYEQDGNESDSSGQREWEFERMKRAGRGMEAKKSAQSRKYEDLKCLLEDESATSNLPGLSSFELLSQQFKTTTQTFRETICTEMTQLRSMETKYRARAEACMIEEKEQRDREQEARQRAAWIPYLMNLLEMVGTKRAHVHWLNSKHMSDFEYACRQRRKQRMLARGKWLRGRAMLPGDEEFEAKVVCAFLQDDPLIDKMKESDDFVPMSSRIETEQVHALWKDRLRIMHEKWLRIGSEGVDCKLSDCRDYEAPDFGQAEDLSECENGFALPFDGVASIQQDVDASVLTDIAPEYADFELIVNQILVWKELFPNDFEAAEAERVLAEIGEMFGSLCAMKWNALEDDLSGCNILPTLANMRKTKDHAGVSTINGVLRRMLLGSSILRKLCAMISQLNWTSKRDIKRVIRNFEHIYPWLQAFPSGSDEYDSIGKMIYEAICESVESFFEEFSAHVHACIQHKEYIPNKSFVHSVFWNMSKAVWHASRIGSYLFHRFQSQHLKAEDSRLSSVVAEKGISQGLLPVLMREEFGDVKCRIDCLYSVISELFLWPRGGGPWWHALRTKVRDFELELGGETEEYGIAVKSSFAPPTPSDQLKDIIDRISVDRFSR